MKKLKYLFFILCLFLNLYLNSFALQIFDNGNSSNVIYCNGGKECSLDNGIDQVKNNINGIEKTDKLSVFVQKKVIYLMSFVTLIGILYIIYGGFRVMTSAGDEKAQESAKKIIISILIGILIMWLSYAIVNFIYSVIAGK